MDAVTELVARIRSGHAVSADELRALLEGGVDPNLLLDALVAAAEGPESRRFHRALSLLRDVRAHRV
jgi:hypothetical protein